MDAKENENAETHRDHDERIAPAPSAPVGEILQSLITLLGRYEVPRNE